MRSERGTHMRLMTVAFALSVAGCGNYLNNNPTGPGAKGPGSDDPSCTIAANGQQSPGYPYSLDDYKNTVLPFLVSSCALSGCHAPPGQGGYIVYPDAAFGNCNYAKSFTQLIKGADLANPANSLVYTSVTGGDPGHPVKLDKA